MALLGGFWLPARDYHWAFRFLSALVFCAYAAYLGYEFFISGEEFEFAGSEDASSPLSALLGFIVIGVPSGTYALLGRFTWRKEDEDHHFLGPG